MKILMQSIDRNILKVVCQECEKEHLPGAQILPSADAEWTQGCQICAEQKEGEIVFWTEDGILQDSQRFVLRQKRCFVILFPAMPRSL